MKRTDLAYAAGIIDGEGWIGIGRRGGKRHDAYCRVTVGNTSEWLVKWLQFAFGGSISIYNRNPDKWKRQYFWNLNEHQTLDFLKAIYPYLRIKRPQAEIAIQFIENRFKNLNPKEQRRWSVNDKQRAVEEATRIVMSNLNSKGNKP